MLPSTISFFSTSPQPHGGCMGSNPSMLAGPPMYSVQMPSASSSPISGAAPLNPAYLFSPQRSAGGDDKETPINDRSNEYSHEMNALFLKEKDKTPFSPAASPEYSKMSNGSGFTVLADVGSTTAFPLVPAATTCVTGFSDVSGAADRSCSQRSINSGGRRGDASMTNSLANHRHTADHPPVRGMGRESKVNFSGPMSFPSSKHNTTTTTPTNNNNNYYYNTNSNTHHYPQNSSQPHPRRGEMGDRRGAPVGQAHRSPSNARHHYANQNGQNNNNAGGNHHTPVESSRDRRLHLDFKALTKSERQRVVQREAADSDLLDRTVHLRFLPTSMKQGELAAMCAECGPFLRIRICGNSTDSQNWIYGFVEFETREGAMRLMRMNGREMSNGEGKAVLRLKCHTANQPIVDRVFHDADPASNSPCIFGQGNFEHRTLKDALDSYFNLKAKEQRGQPLPPNASGGGGGGKNRDSLTGSLHTLDTTNSSVAATTLTMTTNSAATSVNTTPTRRTTPTLTSNGTSETNMFSVVGGGVECFSEGGGGTLSDAMMCGMLATGTGTGGGGVACATAVVHPLPLGGGTLPSSGLEGGTMSAAEFQFLPHASRLTEAVGGQYPPPSTTTPLYAGLMGGMKEGGSDGTTGGVELGIPTSKAPSTPPVPSAGGAPRNSQLRATAQAFIPPFPLSTAPGVSASGTAPHLCPLPLGVSSGAGNTSDSMGTTPIPTEGSTEVAVPHFSVTSSTSSTSKASSSRTTPETSVQSKGEAPAAGTVEEKSDKAKSASSDSSASRTALSLFVAIDQAGEDWMPPLVKSLSESSTSTPSMVSEEGAGGRGGVVVVGRKSRGALSDNPFTEGGGNGPRGLLITEGATGAAAADKNLSTTVIHVAASPSAFAPSASATSTHPNGAAKLSFVVPASTTFAPTAPPPQPVPLAPPSSLPAFTSNPFSPFLMPISSPTPADEKTAPLPRGECHLTGTTTTMVPPPPPPPPPPAAVVSWEGLEGGKAVSLGGEDVAMLPQRHTKERNASPDASAEVVFAFPPPSSSSPTSPSPFVTSPFHPLTLASQESAFASNLWQDMGHLLPSPSVLPSTAPGVVVLPHPCAPPPSPPSPPMAMVQVKKKEEEVDARLTRTLDSMISNHFLAVSGEEVVAFCAALLRKVFQQGNVYRTSPEHFQEIVGSLRQVLEKLDMYAPLTGSAADTTAGDWTSELPQKATQLRLLTNLSLSLLHMAKRSLRDALPFIYALVRCAMEIPFQSLHTLSAASPLGGGGGGDSAPTTPTTTVVRTASTVGTRLLAHPSGMATHTSPLASTPLPARAPRRATAAGPQPPHHLVGKEREGSPPSSISPGLSPARVFQGVDGVPGEDGEAMDDRDLWVERSANVLHDGAAQCSATTRYDACHDTAFLDDDEEEEVEEETLHLPCAEDGEEGGGVAACPPSPMSTAKTGERWGKGNVEREGEAQATVEASGEPSLSSLDEAHEMCGGHTDDHPLANFHTRDLQFHRYVLHLLLCAGITVEEMMPELAGHIFEFTLHQAEKILHKSNETVRLCAKSMQELSHPSAPDSGASVLGLPAGAPASPFASPYRQPFRSGGYYRLGEEVMRTTGHHSGSRAGAVPVGGVPNAKCPSGGTLTGGECPLGGGGGATTEASDERVWGGVGVDRFSLSSRDGNANGVTVVGGTSTVTAGNDILHNGGSGAAPTRDVTAFPRFFFEHASTCTPFLTVPMENSEFWASLPPMLFMKHFF